MSILEVNHIKKVYKTRMGGDEVTALRDVHFSVEPGEFVAIMGESGSGKTTLLNILASLDTPTAGKVLVDGKDFTTLKDRGLQENGCKSGKGCRAAWNCGAFEEISL